MRNLFIVIEGLDGTGKSTIGPILAQRLQGKYIATPTGKFRRARRMANVSNLTRFLYYLAALTADSMRIGKLLEKQSVVADRYVDSTFATHAAFGVKVYALVNEAKLNLVLPDYVFYLVVDQEERLRRSNGRKKTENDVLMDTDELLQKQTHAAFLARGPIVLDITGMQAEQLVDAMMNEITQRESHRA